MTVAKRTLSLAIPAWNEADNIDELLTRISLMHNSLKGTYDLQVVVCENGSTDRTLEKLRQGQVQYPWLEIVQLSRNFHMEGGMMAALSRVRGDVCVIMSADLQDPPELIPLLLQEWERGYDHVYTVITYRHGESWYRRRAAEIFYWIINRISETPVPRNASDFRLVDQQMYEAFNSLPEKDRMVRAVWGWLGFNSKSVAYERAPRLRGKSSFNPFVTAGFAIRGILASSRTPLKTIPVIGTALSAFSFLGLIAFVVRSVLYGVPFPGFGSLMCIILLLFGLLFLFLSLIAEYIGMIYVETRGRPPYIEVKPRKK
jgi:glycosyltransferase involved in cell wall biosynthesis